MVNYYYEHCIHKTITIINVDILVIIHLFFPQNDLTKKYEYKYTLCTYMYIIHPLHNTQKKKTLFTDVFEDGHYSEQIKAFIKHKNSAPGTHFSFLLHLSGVGL